MDGSTYIAPVKTVEEPWRKVLLKMRDELVPMIPEGKIDMRTVDCGTHACLVGWYERLIGRWPAMNFCLTGTQLNHLFWPEAYGGSFDSPTPASHAELTQHINDVLEGRIK